MVLGGFVEFGEAAAVGAGGCGCGEKGSTASFGTILWIKTKNSVLTKDGIIRNAFQFHGYSCKLSHV